MFDLCVKQEEVAAYTDMWASNTWFILFWILSFILTSVDAGKKAGANTAKSGKSKSSLLAKKRILSELRELNGLGLLLDQPFNTTGDECGIRLGPMKDNFFCWHFSITGVEGSHFEGGLYHGRILLHPEYPRKAPTICMLTPNGRWEIGKEICLSASAHHPETWDPKWNLRTLVLSLRSFMLTHPREIGGIHTRPEVQKKLAAASRSFVCGICGVNHATIAQDASEEDRAPLTLRVLTGRDRGGASSKKKPLLEASEKKKQQRKRESLSLIDLNADSPVNMHTGLLQQRHDEMDGEVIVTRRPMLKIIRIAVTITMLVLSFLGKATVSFNISM